jgi:cytochrome c-type biogenesis protein CcmH
MIIAGLALAVLAAVIVAWPLVVRRDEVTDRNDAALAIFKDQLAEVDRDAAREQISEIEAHAAKTEIKRRMLAASRQGTSSTTTGGSWAIVASALLIPLGGAGIYNAIGSPETPSLPFAERAPEQNEAQELQTLVTELRSRLEADPDGGEARGWELLATTYMNMNRFDQAVFAWSQIINREEATSATWSQYSEALIAQANGLVSPPAREAAERALEIDPLNPGGTFYVALAMDQAGQGAAGRELLLDRIAQEREELPWMRIFRSEANRIGEGLGIDPVDLPERPDAPKGPTQEDIEAASQMSADEQQEFIRSMVNRLADRLADEPDDLEGWVQLARAYIVLEQPKDALAALKSAQPLTVDLPVDNQLRRLVEEGLAQLGG